MGATATRIGVLGLVILLGPSLLWGAGADRGTCDQFVFDEMFQQAEEGGGLRNWKRGPDGRPLVQLGGVPALLIRGGSRLRPTKDADPEGDPLPFRTLLRIADFDMDTDDQPVADGFALVKRGARDEPAGWLPLADLLCGDRPLIDDETGLDRKAFTKPQDTLADTEEPSVNAFPSHDLKPCDREQSQAGCVQLSDFELYYVMAQRGKALLLAEKPVVKLTSTGTDVVGWISEGDAIPWNTAFELRPHELLGTPGSSTVFACAYIDENDALAARDCQPIVGGPQWLRRLMYLPVIRTDEAKGIHEVVISTKAQPAEREGAAGSPILVADVNASLEERVEPERLDNIDVFFLIDGTRSMRPWIEAIVGNSDDRPGLVKQLQETLQPKIDQGVKVRYGYTIFSDTHNGHNPIEDRHPLPDLDCAQPDPTKVAKHNSAFQRKLARFRTVDLSGDDFYEDLYGGLHQALEDIAPCDGNIKLIFVIGDGGYSPEEQRARIKRVWSDDDLIDQASGLEPLLMFFIRPPEDARIVRKQKGEKPAKHQQRVTEYRNARDAFENQAQRLIALSNRRGSEAVGPASDELTELAPDERIQYFDLAEEGAAERMLAEIIKYIDALARPEETRNVLADLRSGASVIEAINKLNLDPDDVPGLLWKKKLAEDLCKRLGPERCVNRVFNLTRTFFVRQDASFTIEGADRAVPTFLPSVMLRASEFDELATFVRKIAGYRYPGSSQVKLQLQHLMTKEAENLLRQPVPPDERFDLLFDILRRGAHLPVVEDSPLLQYEPRDLIAEETALCEIEALQDWIGKVNNIFNTVADGDFRPGFALEDQAADLLCPGGRYNNTRCPGISAKGERIPFIDRAPRRVRLDADWPEAALEPPADGEEDKPGPLSLRQDYLKGREIIYHLLQCYLP